MKESKHVEKPEELDFTSPHFNPLRVLYEPDENVTIPRPDAPIYDNISCFIETKDGVFPKERKEPAKKLNQPSTSAVVTQNETQESKETIATKRKSHKNVLSRMDNTVKGPLTFLKKCMDEKLRIKVYTRGPVNIRGFCIGFLEAFDRHWNLVLKDVFEEWTRRRKQLVPATDEEREKNSRSYEEEINLLSHQRGSLHKGGRGDARVEEADECRKPKTVVRKRLKRKEICERHVDQLLIRGEQIVLVTLESS